jgi:hypothetical protein
MDPDYDPYEDLENCKFAIQELGKAIEALVEANNVQAKQLKRSETRINTMNRRIEALQAQLDATL